MFVCLTGCLPWQKAASDDPRYSRYLSWHTSAMPIRKQPKLFKLVSSKAQRLFRKFLEPKPEKRPITLSDVHKYLEDRWMAKGSQEKNLGKIGRLWKEIYLKYLENFEKLNIENRKLRVF